MKTETSSDNRKMPIAPFVRRDRSYRRKSHKILVCNPLQFPALSARRQPDVGGDLEPAHKGPGGFLQQPDFRSTYGQGHRGSYCSAFGLARFAIKTRGYIDGKHLNPSGVHSV